MVADLSRVDESFDTAELKVAQLAFREAEIEETVRVLRAINDGSGSTIFEMNPRKEGEDLVNWEGRLDMTNVTMAGHSYGATGALQALKGAPCKERPFHGGLILDPYVPTLCNRRTHTDYVAAASRADRSTTMSMFRSWSFTLTHGQRSIPSSSAGRISTWSKTLLWMSTSVAKLPGS